jgi:hypothetical protein
MCISLDQERTTYGFFLEVEPLFRSPEEGPELGEPDREPAGARRWPDGGHTCFGEFELELSASGKPTTHFVPGAGTATAGNTSL